MNWYDQEGDDLKARDTLLKHYSSECTIHGGYLITVAIGVFAFFQLIDFINRFVIYPELFIVSTLSLFVALSIYLLAKTIFWGILTSVVIYKREKTVQQVEKIIHNEQDKNTLLLRLHLACCNFFEDKHKFLSFLVGSSRKVSYTILIYLFFAFITALILHTIVIPVLFP